MVPLEEIFCFIDDFCKAFERTYKGRCLPRLDRSRNRSCRLSLAEVMTILVLFQLSHYRTFKDFYVSCLLVHHRNDFHLVSYNRFLELIPYASMPLLILLVNMPGEKTDRYFIDSTKLEVCHNFRIMRNKVFKGFAQRGKTSTVWFFGFKLHLIINHKGELMSFRITPGNVSDVCVVADLAKALKGWLFGDKGYVSQKLAQQLSEKGLEFVTTLRKTMKKQFIEPIKKWWLEKRGIVETVIGQLKALLHLQHTRHRSPSNFLTNVLATLLAYVLKPKKPKVTFAQVVQQMARLTSS